jgi:peptide deformylase
MSLRHLHLLGSPVLRQHSAEVGAVDDDARRLVEDLFETMDAANGVGLAANQIGDDRRVFVYDCPDPELGERRRGVVVNPVLTTSAVPETMPDPDDDEEGCLSVPGESFPTGRAEWAEVTGTDVDGAPVTVSGHGYLARCLQHETDHLDGFVYTDRLVGRNKRAAKRAIRDHGWGVPGTSWMPGVDPDPFGH